MAKRQSYCSPLVGHLTIEFSRLRGDFMVAGHGLMYIGPPVLGETSALRTKQ
jgi:hypothetical protein